MTSTVSALSADDSTPAATPPLGTTVVWAVVVRAVAAVVAPVCGSARSSSSTKTAGPCFPLPRRWLLKEQSGFRTMTVPIDRPPR
ncbi:hypothetical protein [Streptomyces sp. NPDC017202]|uniref:hypothetical protein n=1 Tax=Streptomyces sp. NPDC017202 TaxID=3364981 RepID=UPI00379E0B89